MLKFIVLFSCCVVLSAAYTTKGKDLKCGKHEEVLCLHPCPPVTTCQNLYVAVSCVTPTEPCENQCVCKDGRVRNAKNECVPVEKCEPFVYVDKSEDIINIPYYKDIVFQ
ncbi:venom peptide CtAPI-like isoform X1 [Spodoptera litura]|uniref:Venom peptide CtAPI-like isoform X1 n=1 Tax=Spodoptera litura TaxID=69820 RepID=A0A9J7DQV4_SPOLT|nr:venom peptide CtAPI-like isoform X1 [Spodoptera litura]